MRRLLPAVAAVLCLVAPAAHAAKPPATVTGKLSGAKLPPKGKSRIPVWAVHLPDGLIAGGTTAGANGRFTLKLPAGSYAILTALVPASGRGAPLIRVADFVTAKAGKRRAIKPTLKQRHKRKRRKAHAAAHAPAQLKWVDADYPVVWVHKWSTPAGDAELGVLQKGMQAMLITDLSAQLGGPDCPGAVSAGDDLDKVLSEIKLQESPYFDQSQRLTTAKLVRPNSSVTGSMSRSGGLLTITATYEDQRPGKTRSGTVSVTGAEDSVFALEQALVTKIVDLVCKPVQPAYTGTFSGTWTSRLNDDKVTWTGNAIIELTSAHGSPPTDGPEPLDYAHYAVRSGRVHATLDGTRVGGGVCTVHGEADFDLVAGVLGGESFVQADVDRPWFALSINGQGDEAIPYTETGFGCNQVDPQYPLTGVQWVSTPKPLQSGDGLGLTGNTSSDAFGGTSHLTWAFNFSPLAP